MYIMSSTAERCLRPPCGSHTLRHVQGRTRHRVLLQQVWMGADGNNMTSMGTGHSEMSVGLASNEAPKAQDPMTTVPRSDEVGKRPRCAVQPQHRHAERQ